MQRKTSITKDTESYRRGVIFGLTMAETLLLLVFCILLFLSILNERLKEKVIQHNDALTTIESMTREKSAILKENEDLRIMISSLSAKIVNNKDTPVHSDLSQKILEASATLEITDPQKADQLLYALNKNPNFLKKLSLATIDEWSELTTKAQYSVSENEFSTLTSMSSDQRQNFFANAKIAAQTSPEILSATLEQIENSIEPIDVDEKKQDNPGHNWPPIISLSEAKDYSFKVGSANLSEKFQDALLGNIADQIHKILIDYDADVVEVIGHTDPQPMGQNTSSNLDGFSVDFFTSDKKITLSAKDNAGLGYARALSVTKTLMQSPKLSGFTILPYSAGQMITPDEMLQTGNSSFDSSQLRRIEIRVRRKQ